MTMTNVNSKMNERRVRRSRFFCHSFKHSSFDHLRARHAQIDPRSTCRDIFARISCRAPGKRLSSGRSALLEIEVGAAGAVSAKRRTFGRCNFLGVELTSKCTPGRGVAGRKRDVTNAVIVQRMHAALSRDPA